MSRFKFFAEEADLKDRTSMTNPDQAGQMDALADISDSSEIHARYRVEQLTISRMNGVVHSHAETKREFFVSKRMSQQGLTVNVRMEDNIVKVYPEAMQEAINLLIDLDVVKSDVAVLVNGTNGKIDKVLNHEEICEKWKQYRKKLEERFSFMVDPESRLNLLKYLTVAENTIVIEKNLIADLNTKMFYDLFFDVYLTLNVVDYDNFSRPFYSQLFEGEESILDFSQKIDKETETQIQLKKEGNVNDKSVNSFKMEKLYNEKFKPMIEYKFSAYNAQISEQILINKTEKWIEQANVNIVEEVKNNVEILVDYKLRKIE